MTATTAIDDVLTVLGSAGGVLLLAVMAVVPVLLDAPVPAPRATVPRPRRPGDQLVAPGSGALASPTTASPTT